MRKARICHIRPSIFIDYLSLCLDAVHGKAKFNRKLKPFEFIGRVSWNYRDSRYEDISHLKDIGMMAAQEHEGTCV